MLSLGSSVNNNIKKNFRITYQNKEPIYLYNILYATHPPNCREIKLRLLMQHLCSFLQEDGLGFCS